MITQAQLDNWFTYHPPESDEQLEAYDRIRAAGKHLASTILKYTPPSADQSAAVRLVRSAVWTSNASVACKGE